MRSILFFLFLGITLFATGCTNTNTFDVRAAEYIQPAPPKSDQVRIYVFRENSSFGKRRKLSVINNDEVVGVLYSGSYTHYTSVDRENEVVIYMSPSPLNHFRVRENFGENVYLFFKMGYTSGIYLEEISKEKAKELMKSFKYTEIGIKGKKAKMDYKQYYNNLYK